jgi:IMP cyclohydrolase
MNLADYLRSVKYPGRGIVSGTTPDGKFGVIIYFITGRSENSRNRVFVQDAHGTLRTVAYDPSKLEDPTLVIYNAVRWDYDEPLVVVSNGTQTDDIYAHDGFLSHTLSKWDYEPDSLCTPRISGLVFTDDYTLSILKASNGPGSKSERQYFNYPRVAGVGHFIRVYGGDNDAPTAVEGTPLRIDVPVDGELLDALWDALDADNKIAIYSAKFPLGGEEWNSNTVLTRIKNRLG